MKKKWSDNIERINVEYDSMTLLKLSKHLLGTGKHVVLLGVYLPPSSSNYCHETDIQNGVAMFERCILDMTESFGDLPLILPGDFTARTGNDNSDVADIVDCCFDIFANNEDQYRLTYRASKNDFVTDFGRYLLNVCTQFDLTVLNGSADGSNLCNYTYVSLAG